VRLKTVTRTILNNIEKKAIFLEILLFNKLKENLKVFKTSIFLAFYKIKHKEYEIHKIIIILIKYLS
jgi:hypothetical protein